MRHNVYGKKLGRNKNQRTALFRNLVRSLLAAETITTSEAKAKAIRGTVDRLINQAKSPSAKNLIGQFLASRKAEEKLTRQLLPRLQTRRSGYTSLVRLGRRLGDDSPRVQMMLLLDEIKPDSKKTNAPGKEGKSQVKSTPGRKKKG